MAKVAPARIAHDFHASHAVAHVEVGSHARGGGGLVKAGPAAVAFEFGPGVKQLGATPHADVHAIFVVEPKLA